MTIYNRSAASIEKGLEDYRADAIEQVRLASEPIRAAFITQLPAQDMLYVEKRDEAMAYVAEDPEPTDLSEYALLAAEVGITAPDVYAVAQFYLNLKHYGKLAFAALETPRLRAIDDIETAVSTAEVDAALSTFLTDLEALS